jgi:5'-nucleotidase
VRILLTNDDGIGAPGLTALAAALREDGELWIVAPEREQSASSHALTLNDPLRVQRRGARSYALSGTPTDCVLVGVRGIVGLMEPRPELVVAGINHGPNMGEDVTYSGTVAAAIEGSLLGLPAIAFSNAAWHPEHLDACAAVARRMVALFRRSSGFRAGLLNVNIPDRPLAEIAGVRITHLGKRVYRDEIQTRTDPRGRQYYWIGGDPPVWEADPLSDFGAVSSGFVSVTPLRMDWTDHAAIEALRGLEAAWTTASAAPGG